MSSFTSPKNLQDLIGNTAIDSNGPGSVLRDIEAALEFISTESPDLMADHMLPPEAVKALDERLYGEHTSADGGSPQPFFAHVNGIYLLLRASRLTKIESVGRRRRLCIDSAAEKIWRTLNPAERYFALLEVWLLYGDSETLAGRRQSWQDVVHPLDLWWNFFRILKPQTFYEEDLAEQRRFWPAMHNLALMQMFGLISIVDMPSRDRRGWQTDAVLRTDWADALLALIAGEASIGQDRSLEYKLFRHGLSSLGDLQVLIQPLRPDWVQALLPSNQAARETLFLFKVLLGEHLWREMTLPAASTLQDLSDAILHAFGFKRNHLYRFFYPDHLGLTEVVVHPDLDVGPPADEVLIGDLRACPGFRMVYNYDFVENWLFDVVLSSTPAGVIRHPRYRLGSWQGDAPDQYHGKGDGWFS